LYGYETWSLTLREEKRLRVFENRVLKGIFGPKRDEITGEWRKLNSWELHNLYSSPDIIRKIKARRVRWANMWHAWGRGETCAASWFESPRERDHLEDGGVDGKMESKWTLGRLIGVQRICLAQERDQWQAVVNAVMNLWVLAPRSLLAG
jgi:hypothetical protein